MRQPQHIYSVTGRKTAFPRGDPEDLIFEIALFLCDNPQLHCSKKSLCISSNELQHSKISSFIIFTTKMKFTYST